MAQRTLNSPIVLKNVTKIECTKLTDHADDTAPFVELYIQLKHQDGTAYGGERIAVARNGQCTVLTINPSPRDDADMVISGSADIPNAYTAIMAAFDGAAGSRAAKREAAMVQAVTSGLLGAGLAST